MRLPFRTPELAARISAYENALTGARDDARRAVVHAEAAALLERLTAACQRFGVPLGGLPLAERRLFQRLATLTGREVVSESSPTAPPRAPTVAKVTPTTAPSAPATIRLSGTVAQLETLFVGLSSGASPTEIAARASKHSAHLERLCGPKGGVSQVAGNAGAAARHLSRLADPQYTAAIARGIARFKSHLGVALECKPLVGGALWRYRAGVLVLQPELYAAPDDLIDAIGETLRHRRRPPDLVAKLDTYLAGRNDAGLHRPAGRTRDLDLLFDDLNVRFFGGTLARPVLAWSPRATHRRFGVYFPHRDRVELNPLLDGPEVALETTAYVLYHELLHKVHGAEHRGGRRHVHTPAFRRDEARFPDAARHEAILGDLAQAAARGR